MFHCGKTRRGRFAKISKNGYSLSLMTTPVPEWILQEYLARLEQRAGRGDAREESFYSAFADLLRQTGAQLGQRIDVTTIPRKEQECLLDFQVWNGGRVAGYVEAKRPGTDLEAAAETEQLRRYRATFPNLLLTDFRQIRLFRHGELAARAEIFRDSAAGWLELSGLLDRFFSFGGVTGPASAAGLATALAGRTRVLAACVLDLLREERESGEVSRIGGLLLAFREYLRADLGDKEFTDLYAQTIAYGLLAARLRRQDRFELRSVIENIPRGSGILRDVFEVLSLGDLPGSLRWIIEDLVDLLAAAPIQTIVKRDFDPLRRRDVIQHFYETFLRAFDKELRKKRGVYYTPQPVVSFMVRSVQALLRSRLGFADGLADPGVVLLDPAAGTLTFLTEAFRVALEAYAEAHGPGGRAALVRDHLLPHFHAFEVMMAPYAIGHWRARLFFEEHGLPLADDQRVRLYLTNALELRGDAADGVSLHRRPRPRIARSLAHQDGDGGHGGDRQSTLVRALGECGLAGFREAAPGLLLPGGRPAARRAQSEVAAGRLREVHPLRADQNRAERRRHPLLRHPARLSRQPHLPRPPPVADGDVRRDVLPRSPWQPEEARARAGRRAGRQRVRRRRAGCGGGDPDQEAGTGEARVPCRGPRLPGEERALAGPRCRAGLLAGGADDRAVLPVSTPRPRPRTLGGRPSTRAASRCRRSSRSAPSAC